MCNIAYSFYCSHVDIMFFTLWPLRSMTVKRALEDKALAQHWHRPSYVDLDFGNDPRPHRLVVSWVTYYP